MTLSVNYKSSHDISNSFSYLLSGKSDVNCWCYRSSSLTTDNLFDETATVVLLFARVSASHSGLLIVQTTRVLTAYGSSSTLLISSSGSMNFATFMPISSSMPTSRSGNLSPFRCGNLLTSACLGMLLQSAGIVFWVKTSGSGTKVPPSTLLTSSPITACVERALLPPIGVNVHVSYL